MSWCRQVAPDVWLGFGWCTPVVGGHRPEQRWLRDREAADRAVAAVVTASGLGRDACTISRSHTLGVAVAVAAPAGVRVGVDLVAVERVNPRHARAVVADGEWKTLNAYASVRPALAWATKEAAAKATGEPLGCFPHGLSIEAGPSGLIVREAGGGRGFTADWGLVGGFLYAWVVELRAEQESRSLP